MSPNTNATVPIVEGYEYVIVGSGPGGGPLAANLARSGHKVLLLEAGDDQGDSLNEQVPIFFPNGADDSSMRWDFFVKHYSDEKQAAKDPKLAWDTPDGLVFVGLNPPAGSKQKGILYPRAGTLGGCATHNALLTVLPPDQDWDDIAKLTGDDTWNAKHMRRYFERVERNEFLPDQTPGHGFKGWLETELPDRSIYEATEPFIESALATQGRNAKLIRDINAIDPQNKDGVYKIPLQMSRTGRRASPRNYLVATANAKNRDDSKRYPLDIWTDCFVTKILFDKETGDKRHPKAIGVEFLQGKSQYKADPRFNPRRPAIKKHAFASRETIIAGGAFNTPQILKLSGIGPKSELEKHKIPVVVDLPGVGTNLQDNYEYGVVGESPEIFSPYAKGLLGASGDPLLADWVEGHGPYKSSAVGVGVIEKSSVAKDDRDLFVFSVSGAFTGFFPGWTRPLFTTPSSLTWDILKVHPRNNAGTVKLISNNPHDTPEINFNYYHEASKDGENDPESDLTAMADGVALVRRIFAGVKGPLAPVTETAPGASVDTIKEIKESIKNETFGHHATSSCPIGADDDPMACLDSKFRVRGVKNLRVVDACVFPKVPGSFPTLPIYMCSEKATDDLLSELGEIFREDHDDKTLEF